MILIPIDLAIELLDNTRELQAKIADFTQYSRYKREFDCYTKQIETLDRLIDAARKIEDEKHSRKD